MLDPQKLPSICFHHPPFPIHRVKKSKGGPLKKKKKKTNERKFRIVDKSITSSRPRATKCVKKVKRRKNFMRNVVYYDKQ